METKTDKTGIDKICRGLGRDWDAEMIPSAGKAGGIAIMWRKDRVSIQGVWCEEQVLFGVVRDLQSLRGLLQPFMLAITVV